MSVFFLFSAASSLQIGKFVYCIDSYPLCLKVSLHLTMQMGLVFLLKMFQDKCTR